MQEIIGDLTNISIRALENSFKIHEKLGVNGKEKITKNRFGEKTLRIDVGAEKAVINTFKRAKIPIRIISEEHGVVDIVEDPIYLGVLDGLDGTKEYKKARNKGRYGTMFGLFSNLNPKYEDYLFGGFMEHSTNKLFYVSKGKGSFVKENNLVRRICCNQNKKLNKDIRIYLDFEFDQNRNITLLQDTFVRSLKNHIFLHENSMGVHLIDVACGEADLALHSTRKGNLEIATAYGIIKESGGVVVTVNGKNLGKKNYLKFGQEKFVPVISASSK